MKISYMKEFLTLAEEMNFTQTAEKLYLGQPSLSRHMSALEESVGARLLERDTHKVRLTPEGEIARVKFKRIVDEFRGLQEKISEMSSDKRSSLKVGILLHSMSKYIEPILPGLIAEFGEERINFELSEAQNLIEGIQKDKYDICMMIRVRFADDEEIRYHKYDKMKFVAVVAPDDLLASKDKISVSQLNNRVFVFAESASNYVDQINGILSSWGVYPKAIVTAPELSHMYSVRRSHGVAVVSEDYRTYYSETMHFLDIKEDIYLDICWAYKIKNTNPMIPAFINYMDVCQP